MGYCSTTGKLEVSGAGTTLGGEVKGHGFGFHGVGVMDYAATSEIHLGVRVGYRIAKTTDLKDATDQPFQTADGTDEKAYWSGLITRAGITMLFGKAE